MLCRDKAAFPSILKDKPTLDLTVVVPAYKEEKRISPMMDSMLSVLEAAGKQKG